VISKAEDIEFEILEGDGSSKKSQEILD